MVKQKFYAVRVGRIPGVYETWEQAQEQIKGFSGAKYKSFLTEEEAISYISLKEVEESDNLSDKTFEINQIIELEIKNLQEEEVIAFVYGSYSNTSEKEKYSFGVVLITNKSENSLYKAFVDKTNMATRNIAGEIEGVKQAILWAIDSKKQKIKIFYNYEGIEKWATKEWKTNVKLSQDYSKFFDEKSKLIKIEFEHVKAHSGIIYNEKADKLAKRALLSQGYKTYNDGSIYFIGFQKQDWFNIVASLNDEISEEDTKNKIDIETSSPRDYLDKLLLNI